MTDSATIQALNILPNLMSAHPWVHWRRGAWGVGDEKDRVGAFVGRWSAAKMVAKTSDVEGR